MSRTALGSLLLACTAMGCPSPECSTDEDCGDREVTAGEASAEEMTFQGFIEDVALLDEIQRVRDLEGCQP